MHVGGLPIHQAIGTSLFVIFVTGATSILMHLQFSAPDWGIVGLFSGGGVVGALVGSLLVSRVRGAVLEKGFGIALVGAALLVLLAY